MSSTGQFVVATPLRSVCDDNARALHNHRSLRLIALGTRRGTSGIPSERTRLLPILGLLTYAAARTLSPYRAESFRFSLLPVFDHWVKRLLVPGDHIISSFGYANECFEWIRARGGKTFLDGGNSHPENFWNILAAEHRRWNCPLPPVSPFWHRRSIEMMEHVDYVLSPSSYVTQSFLARGFKPEQILRNVYPVDLSCFTPATAPRPKNRPLTVISTGSLSLRKGTPYMLEAFRMIHRRHPSARFLLSDLVTDTARSILAQYQDLPINWAPALGHPQLAERLRSADVFVLPSLEEGLVRTALEAMACGLPVVVTPNTGANDLVESGINGSIVPIRDAAAVADAVMDWGERAMSNIEAPRRRFDANRLSFAHFEAEFIDQLCKLEILACRQDPALR
jgi:glycosyltransferase involved in cell wall biosynthesis